MVIYLKQTKKLGEVLESKIGSIASSHLVPVRATDVCGFWAQLGLAIAGRVTCEGVINRGMNHAWNGLFSNILRLGLWNWHCGPCSLVMGLAALGSWVRVTGNKFIFRVFS